jgi:hypothetical protein
MSSPKYPDQLQHPPRLQLNVNQGFFSGSKVARGLSAINHICLVPSLKFTGVIPPLNLSPSMPHIGTSALPPNYVPLPKAHFLSGVIGSFLYITYFSHAHHWTHLFSLHWSNYTNITKSSNNEPHYIIFCVPLLLTPFTRQIFSWPLFSRSPSSHIIAPMCPGHISHP